MKTKVLLFSLILFFGCTTFEKKTKKQSTQVDSVSASNSPYKDSTIKIKAGVINGLIMPTDSALETKIFQRILKLRKIQRLDRFIDSVSNHSHGVSMMFTMKPHDNIDYYYLEAGYDTPDRFITSCGFYIYNRGQKINFNDPLTGTQIPIEKWDNLK